MTTDSVPASAIQRTSVRAAVIVATLGVLYIVSQFLRNSVGVIAPDIAAELKLSPLDIGLLSSIYFFCFAAMQLPLGVALDRFGPKRCLVATIALAGVGCAVFALAPNLGGLVTGRVLVGFGTAAFLMAPLALYARWFAPERFSTVAGIHLGVGTFGALFATAPLAFAAANFGWRAAFFGVGIFTMAIGVLILAIVSDDPPGSRAETKRETLRESIAGVWAVIRTPSMGRIFLVQVASYPSYLLIVGLWGGPYLAHIYGYDLKGRGDILFVPALAQLIGSFLWGPTDRLFGRYKPPVLIGLAGTLTALLLLAALGAMPGPVLIAVLALLGFATGTISLVLSHGRALVPPHLLGRAITLLNMGAMGGGFLVQFISGAVIDLFPAVDGAYPLAAYRLVFALQAALVLVAGIAYFCSRDGHLAAK